MFHFHPQQLPEVQHFQNKAVRLLSLKKVAKLFLQMPFARVTVDAINADENVGVRARSFHVPGDDNEFVLHRDQVSDFARKALDGFKALKCQEFVFFGCQGDLCITVEEIPKKKEGFEGTSTGHFI